MPFWWKFHKSKPVGRNNRGKVWRYQKDFLFCNRVMSERKRTGTMKALVNDRIERYLAIEMWKFQKSANDK